jgi:hypothetical protein
VDCGGACPPCATDLACSGDGDCQSGKCADSTCVDNLLISQVQTRGSDAGNDEFVELYNAGAVDATFGPGWALKSRNAIGGIATCATNALGVRATGAGERIPAHGHLLLSNPAYDGAVTADGSLAGALPDAASLVLVRGSVVVDALCFYFDSATEQVLTGCTAAPYICAGAPVQNPHNNSATSNQDSSLERKPGGASGNGQNTGDNRADFVVDASSDPRDLASAPAP